MALDFAFVPAIDEPSLVVSLEACDLLAIDGRSKPRWGESMFGGVIHRMLIDPPLPVLMVH